MTPILRHGGYDVILPLLLLLTTASCYSNFRSRIPNAKIVPHPCEVGKLWKAVGHEQQGGGGPRNPFGTDFHTIGGGAWTKTLCEMDSDGDGMSNGKELGDPDCVWTPGQDAARTTDITHPGICDPFGVGICAGKDQWVTCNTEKFECDALNDTNVKSFELVYPRTLVPKMETNYVCFNFDIPTDQNYYLRAYEPLIDNWNVMHHIVVRGCRYPSITPLVDEPYDCGMSSPDCPETIALWAIGINGYCLPNDVGVPFGATGFKRFQLEFHWNNPFLVDNYFDASGIRFYYEPERPGLMGAALYYITHRMLNIPPGQKQHTESTTCPGSCTAQHLTGPINIFSSANHMHYLGKSQTTTLWRNGSLVATLAHDPVFSYDSPAVHTFDPPVQMLPGDDLKTTCVFDSSKRKRITRYGSATSDEMCVAYAFFYPLSNARKFACPMYNPLSPCDMEAGTPLGLCDWKNFTTLRSADANYLFKLLERNCDVSGMCRPECLPVVKQVMQHPCMYEKYRHFINEMMDESIQGLQFLSRSSSCRSHCPTNPGDHGHGDWYPTQGAVSLVGSLVACLTMAGVGRFIH